MPNSGVLGEIGYLATCKDSGRQADIYPIQDAAIAFENGRIVWVGQETNLPVEFGNFQRFSAGGRTVIPGLVDCHTHLAFGGWRADEFRMRIEGQSYLDIAAAGGGIRKTMAQTRLASAEDLLDHCLAYAQKVLEIGVTAIECKTGYGLSLEAELKILRVYRQLALKVPQDVVSTLLAAHIIPPDDKCNRECYIKMICEELIPLAASEKLASFNDIFVENGAYTAAEAEHILGVGGVHGLIPKLHVDQLSEGGGGELAARVGAISADHLEFTSANGIAAMSRANVTAVCLPFASLYLNQPPMKARSFLDAGVNVAVATDFNPGSAPCYDLPLAMMLACTMSRMTPAEAVKGATLMASKAIGKDHDYGSIEIGKRANFVELEVEDVEHWLYHFRSDTCSKTWIDGSVSYQKN